MSGRACDARHCAVTSASECVSGACRFDLVGDAKHTTSPWHTGGVFLPGTPDVHVTVWSAPRAGDQSGDEVAKYVHPRDAALIVAAPDLLAATKRGRRKLATYASVYPGDKELRGLLAEWDAAILKATGCQS